MGPVSLGELRTQCLKVVSSKIIHQPRLTERTDNQLRRGEVVSERGRPNVAGIPLLLFRGKKMIAQAGDG